MIRGLLSSDARKLTVAHRHTHRICGASALDGFHAKEPKYLYNIPATDADMVFDTLPIEEVNHLKAALMRRGSARGRTISRAAITRLFDASKCQSGCFVSASPSNLRIPTAPSTLEFIMSAQERARARFVAIVREPISRDIS